MRMAAKVPVNGIGEEGKKLRLIQPRGPSRELNAAATTTVGSMKGMAVSARKRDLPRKSKRAKRIAEGMPSRKVRIVESAAW
jgi:hypothetical protein